MADEDESMIAQEPAYGRRKARNRLLIALALLLSVGGASAAFLLLGGNDLGKSALAAIDPEDNSDIELLTSRRERDIDLLFRSRTLGPDDAGDDDGEAIADDGQRLVETIIKSGDTLARALADAGADKLTAHNAALALGKLTDLRRLRPGQELALVFDNGTDALVEVRLKESVERTVFAKLNAAGGYDGSELKAVFTRELVRSGAVIDDSLFLSAGRAGIEHAVIAELIRMFSFDVDFQRGIHPGDSFELTYERFNDESGEVAKTGRILKATLIRKSKPLTYYRYHPKGAIHPDYFNAKGQSARKTLMQTPIDGARISSGFGRRRHPIRGYVKQHKGVDFAARSGTPIMAAGDGTVEAVGWNGGYGRYIRLRHNGTYKTAYAHMKSFRRGLKKGQAVKQGQIIGYVGSTGASTGPHLHYEVLKNNRQVNPRSIKLPTGIKLAGSKLKAFKSHVSKLDATIAALPAPEKTSVTAAADEDAN